MQIILKKLGNSESNNGPNIKTMITNGCNALKSYPELRPSYFCALPLLFAADGGQQMCACAKQFNTMSMQMKYPLQMLITKKGRIGRNEIFFQK